MAISREDIQYVADLARLKLDDASIERFAEQIGDILAHVDALKRVDTEDVKPTSHAIFLSNAFRNDEVKVHLANEDALANAPEKEDGAFVVPKVVG